MALKDKIAALLGKKSKDADLKKGLAHLLKAEEEDNDKPEGEEDDKPEGEEEEDRPEGEEDDNDPDAETGDEDEDAEDDEEEPSAKAKGNSAGFALVGSTAARGREKLAAELGRKVADGKMTYGEAKKLLGAAPKGGRLGEAMRGRDVNPGAGGGGSGKAGAALATSMDRQLKARGLKPVEH